MYLSYFMYISFITCTVGEKISQLQKVVGEYSYDISQLQARLDIVQREKQAQDSKALEQERMYNQMKQNVAAEIDYLRKLNLQFVEQQMKGIIISTLTLTHSHPHPHTHTLTLINLPPHVTIHLKALNETNLMIPITLHTLTLHTLHTFTHFTLHMPHTLTAEKATEILKEVQEAQDTFKRQGNLSRIESEVSVCVGVGVWGVCVCVCVGCVCVGGVCECDFFSLSLTPAS